MTPLNDNGPRPEGGHTQYKGRRRGILFLLIAVVILIIAPVLAVAALVTVRHTLTESVETIETLERTNLSVITHVDQINNNSIRKVAEDIRLLNITMRNGNLTIVPRDDDEQIIEIHSQRPLQYQTFGVALNITEQANTDVNILVPANLSGPVFDSLSVRSRNGSILLAGGEDGSIYLTENLSLENRNGVINLADIQVSGQFELENRNGTIHLHNVVAYVERVSVETRNGSVYITE